jgi:hypothetical protein
MPPCKLDDGEIELRSRCFDASLPFERLWHREDLDLTVD